MINSSNKKYCVYTCLIGNYDCLYNYRCYDDEFDYICFTDIPELIDKKIERWRIIKVDAELSKKYDPTRLNRYYKIQYYKKMKQYDMSIYIDTNMSIKTDYIYNIAKNMKGLLLVPKNIYTDNVYEQIIKCKINKQDCDDNLERIYHFLLSESFPINYGFTENNLLIRKHNNKTVDSIMDQWWYFVENYSKRDQLSFTYVLWKNHINLKDILIQNVMHDNINFIYHPHLTIEWLHIWRSFILFKPNERLYTPLPKSVILQRILISTSLYLFNTINYKRQYAKKNRHGK